MSHPTVKAFVSLAGLAVVLSVAGCADEPQKPETHPGDAILKDPMGYKPQADENADISGGGLMHLDKKAFKKDVDSVLNP